MLMNVAQECTGAVSKQLTLTVCIQEISFIPCTNRNLLVVAAYKGGKDCELGLSRKGSWDRLVMSASGVQQRSKDRHVCWQ